MLLNRRPITKILFAVMAIVGAAMLIPAFVALYYNEKKELISFAACAVPMIIGGFMVVTILPKEDNTALRMRDGFFIVACTWIMMSALGALPFVLSGSIPNFIDAYFETASGFTTTGATIVNDIEGLPKSILFWRSFTHWLGGMGVLVLTIAILPMLGIGGQKIMRAETTGPTMDKISFTTNASARNLYIIYGGMTIIEILLLRLAGSRWFDAATHTFGTVGTGGLSVYSDSIGHYNNVYIEMIIGVFMMLAGINFGLYYFLLRGKAKLMFKDTELRVYLGIIAVSSVFIAVVLLAKNYYSTFLEALRYSFFQVSSIITTTGYGTTDFDLWPVVTKIVLFLLMIVGGCASSTGGGIKVIRAILTFKIVRRAIRRRLHEKEVRPIRLGGKNMPEETIRGVKSFMVLFILMTVIGTLVTTFDGYDIETSLSAVIACISNIGPGFAKVGPMMNYTIFSPGIKVMLAIYMIAGRLELYTIILMFTPVFWDENR